MAEIKYDWFEDNKEYLMAKIQQVKLLLQDLTSSVQEANDKQQFRSTYMDNSVSWPHDNHLPALEKLSQIFHLSNFEKSVLLLCAGAEIDGEISALCSKLYKNPNTKFPTFDIALRIFPQADWQAVLPDSNLRRYQLITLQTYDDIPLIICPIRIQERVLHFLLGFESVVDTRLDYLVRPAHTTAPVPESHKAHIAKIIEFSIESQDKRNPVIFHLWGPDLDSNLLVAQKACEKLGLGIWTVPGELIHSKIAEEQSLSTLLGRESFLSNRALFIDAYDADESSRRTISRFATRCMVPVVFLGTREPWSFSVSDKQSITIAIKRPNKEDQRKIWRHCFERHIQDEKLRSDYEVEVDGLVDRFNLNAVAIESIAKNIPTFQLSEKTERLDPQQLYSFLQSSTYQLTKTKLGDLAEEIIPVSKIDDIVLPTSKKNMIQTIAIHFKHRHKVYDEWGFAKKSSRGLGIIALFSGESGTGKTMAAEAIANQLGTDLYRIDLSMVASKYIGETEKNLRQIFDAAETKECILFFDEADALFGKRSEVRDSHDRYANMQVGYLLQRIESYDGIVILATNFKKGLDPAFLRRIRFIIDFPFPDEKSREEIWRRIFPESVPVGSLDFKFLSKLSVTGGSIRNIALNAAFLAAEADAPVSMDHIRHAAEEEYNKLGRTMTSAEIGNWPQG